MLIISKTIMETIAAHAKQEAPLEACGYLAGKDGVVQEIFKMTNLDKSEEHFSFDPKEQFKAIKDARARGLQLIAVYHSHPNSPARLSSEDIALAYDPSMVHIIYSLLSNEARAFRVNDGEIIPEEIKVV